MILVLGGTHEGKQIAQRLEMLSLPYRLSVTTSLGEKEYARDHLSCIVEKFTKPSLLNWVEDHGVKVIIDSTHPHAREIKGIANEVAVIKKIPYVRYGRNQSERFEYEGDAIDVFESIDELIQKLLKARESHHKYLITGIKHISEFYKYFQKGDCYFRVMPSVFSMQSCDSEGVPTENIIGIKAPCSLELNLALINTYKITHFVFKNSGVGSAFDSNLQAVRAGKIRGCVLEAKKDAFPATVRTIEELTEWLIKVL